MRAEMKIVKKLLSRDAPLTVIKYNGDDLTKDQVDELRKLIKSEQVIPSNYTVKQLPHICTLQNILDISKFIALNIYLKWDKSTYLNIEETL